MAAEFEEFLSALGDERLPDGRRRVVRNGYPPEHWISTGTGAVELAVSKARGRSGAVEPFHSPVARLFLRRAAGLGAAIP